MPVLGYIYQDRVIVERLGDHSGIGRRSVEDQSAIGSGGYVYGYRKVYDNLKIGRLPFGQYSVTKTVQGLPTITDSETMEDMSISLCPQPPKTFLRSVCQGPPLLTLKAF